MNKLTPELEGKLWAAAEEAAAQAYAPYSNFYVGAAILTSEGNIIAGCNVENSSFGVTNCAERTAIFTAVAAGKLSKGISIVAVAVLNRDHRGCAPCGACRQVLSEFGLQAIVLYEMDGQRKQTTVSALLPESFQL